MCNCGGLRLIFLSISTKIRITLICNRNKFTNHLPKMSFLYHKNLILYLFKIGHILHSISHKHIHFRFVYTVNSSVHIANFSSHKSIMFLIVINNKIKQNTFAKSDGHMEMVSHTLNNNYSNNI